MVKRIAPKTIAILVRRRYAKKVERIRAAIGGCIKELAELVQAYVDHDIYRDLEERLYVQFHKERASYSMQDNDHGYSGSILECKDPLIQGWVRHIEYQASMRETWAAKSRIKQFLLLGWNECNYSRCFFSDGQKCTCGKPLSAEIVRQITYDARRIRRKRDRKRL